MSSAIHQTLTTAMSRILRALARVLIRNGVAYGTFAELAKKAYVDVAFEAPAPDGKRQTISRVAAVTGLTRKEVSRLRDLDQPDDLGAEERYNRAVRVITGWVNDPAFQDGDGSPAELPMDGGASSFAELARRHSGDMPPQAMLQALAEAGCAEQRDNRVRLLKRAYVPGTDPVNGLHILGTDAAELIDTINHNLVAEPGARRFQRKVSSEVLPAHHIPDLNALVAERGQDFLEDLSRWLDQREADPDAPETDLRRVSVGLYFFQNPTSGGNDS
jgi:hypothetical protein